VLIDMAEEQGSGSATLVGVSVLSLRENLNKPLINCDLGGSDFKLRAVTRLKNGGILMVLWYGSHTRTRERRS